MVNAIKYWCLAFKIIEETQTKGKKSSFSASAFGSRLLSDEGWDPYLEDPASLWLLHWNLFKSPCNAPVWFFAFNEFNQYEFSTEDLLYFFKVFKNKKFPSKRVNDASLTKDINCLLRMYVKRNGSKKLKEDSLDCPFTELGIISSIADTKSYAFSFGRKTTLSPEIIVSACLDFAFLAAENSKTISISRLLYDSGSPGLIFKLNEDALCDAIEQVSNKFDEISLIDTAGLLQMSFVTEPDILSERILNTFYNKDL
jgi:hypothetical protein